MIDKGMTFAQLHELRDQIAEYLGPQKADRPGTAWIGAAQKELLAACGHGVLKMRAAPFMAAPLGQSPQRLLQRYGSLNAMAWIALDRPIWWTPIAGEIFACWPRTCVGSGRRLALQRRVFAVRVSSAAIDERRSCCRACGSCSSRGGGEYKSAHAGASASARKELNIQGRGTRKL